MRTASVVVSVSHLTAARICRVPESVCTATCFADSTVTLGRPIASCPHDHERVAEQQRLTRPLIQIIANPIYPQLGVPGEPGDPQPLSQRRHG
jgi:hypothetical protein